MIDDGNKRFYRRCDEFAICVNLGKKGYVTAESPEDRNTIFQYIVYGKGKAGIMFTEDNIEFKDRELVDLRRYVHEYVMSIATEDFFIIGFKKSSILFAEISPLVHSGLVGHPPPLRSAPEQKPLPSPVKITDLTFLFEAASSKASMTPVTNP